MHIESGISVLKMPIVVWTQRIAVTQFNFFEGLFRNRDFYDDEYQENFYRVKIIKEKVTLLMGPDGYNEMKLARSVTPLEAKEHSISESDVLGIPLQKVRGFVLEPPPEPVHRWKTATGRARAVPRPSHISVDIGGGELIPIAAHLDPTGSDAPRLRRVLEEWFIEHPIPRQWQADFRNGMARFGWTPPAASAPPAAPTPGGDDVI